MLYQAPGREQVEQLIALNKLFLSFLQASARADADLLDLPRSAASALRQASAAQLDTIAAFPRALFSLRLAGSASALSISGGARTALDYTRAALSLTIVLSAWNTSRQSDYQARLFFMLESETIRFLRTRSLAELPQLACAPGVIRCAFPESATLWRALLRQTGSELPAELALLALQPVCRAAPPRMASMMERTQH